MSALPAITGGGRDRGIAAVALLALGQAVAAAAAAIATRDLFAALGATADGGTDRGLPMIALTIVALSGFGIAACRVGERVIAERLGQNYAETVRLALFSHLARLPVRAVDKRRAGGLALRFTGDLAAFRGWVSLGIARLIAASIVLPAGLAAMVLIDPALATPAAIAVSLGALAMALLGLSFGHLHRRLRRRRAALSARMAERVGKAPELRLLGRLAHERRAFERRSARMIEAAIKRAGAAAVLRAIPDATAGLAAAGVIAAALTGSVSAAQTAGALAAVGFMVQPLRDLAGTWDQRRAFVAARAACETLLAEEPLPRGRVVPVRPSTDQGGAPLAFRGVESAALREIDLRIKAGEHVAILGPNGAGKSALLALAAGLEAPQKGKVLVAGHPVCRLKDGARSRLICHVGAGSPVLDGSLRRALVPQDRVRADGSRLDDAAIEATARRYGLGEVVDRLGGLDGRVTEGARTLSAGERRRLLLTRAALSEADLILLDEPDDALDDTAAALVGRLLRETKATVMLVTHDPAVARLAERTLRIEAGRLAPALPIADFGPESAVAA